MSFSFLAMPTILSNPPAAVQSDLNALTAALNSKIPGKTLNNFLVATWNIRAYSSLTRKWTAGSNDSPKRDLRGLRAIIEILSRFDGIALQEVQGNLRALRDTMKYLQAFGDWGFLMTDITRGDAGNDERLAFIFDRSRVKPSGLAAELVVPPEQLNIGPNALTEQFARTPYAVSFQRVDTTVILVTLHIKYGKNEDDRIPELKALAEWMSDWAGKSNKFHHNLIALGDLNIDREDSTGYKEFVGTGLTIPTELENLPRTIFDDHGESDDDNYYDQIAWFTEGSRALMNLQFNKGGNFDFLPHVYTNTSLSRTSISYRVSEHYPLWVEFLI